MITVGIFEAKSSLGQLVQSVAAGEVVVLTRRGKPVAEICAPDATNGQETQYKLSRLCANSAAPTASATSISPYWGPKASVELSCTRWPSTTA